MSGVAFVLFIGLPGLWLLCRFLGWCDGLSRDRDEPVPGQDPPLHVTVLPVRDWGAEVRAAHKVQQDACIASGDHIAVYDQDTEKGAA